MNPLDAFWYIVGGLFLVYITVRVASAAFFKSKKQFDNQPSKGTTHGT